MWEMGSEEKEEKEWWDFEKFNFFPAQAHTLWIEVGNTTMSAPPGYSSHTQVSHSSHKTLSQLAHCSHNRFNSGLWDPNDGHLSPLTWIGAE